jgi:hypothetical protein
LFDWFHNFITTNYVRFQPVELDRLMFAQTLRPIVKKIFKWLTWTGVGIGVLISLGVTLNHHYNRYADPSHHDPFNRELCISKARKLAGNASRQAPPPTTSAKRRPAPAIRPVNPAMKAMAMPRPVRKVTVAGLARLYPTILAAVTAGNHSPLNPKRT